MVPKQLEPRLELLREEYVLVQAWKKTASYIRYHNWFSDTLALDRAAVNLPAFLGELRERLQSSESWQNDPLRIVPAPKSQRWRVREGVWEPEKGATSARLRPLAHVSLADQVVATALMLCLADRVETRQGDPRRSTRDQESRRQVVSYGNRLFCDTIGSELRHRWGSAKLYRAYYQDYRTFLSRPEVAAVSIPAAEGKRTYIVHADLRQFYDRVRPGLLAEAIDRVRRDGDDSAFFSLVASVLDWGWHSRDERDVRIYAEQADLEDFTRVTLPQGLVASGFFANVVLLPFDEALRAAIGTEIASGILLADACRYVDDLRERWRFQLGFLLRFILSGQPDFTRPVRNPTWRETESTYRAAESHWYQRLYGLYSGQPAFGDDWLPITDWVEGFLLALLRWPGCRAPDGFDWIEQGIEETKTQIDQRIADLEQRRGRATRALILPLLAKRPTASDTKRPLRACVVQTAVPAAGDFHHTDLPLDGAAIRRKHRNHLSAALAAVERMLALRETHKGSEGRLDWLILPELAVHPKDVRTHLVPFARAHRAMILTGLTYEEILAGQPLVNSALWVIPEWSDAYGLQIRTRRQGKAHLAPNEQIFNGGGADRLQGFRTCQWLIGYPWADPTVSRHVRLTAAVCYDATDLGLAADLKDESDVLAIPALNKDVKTFDQMALALHYHMFQLVIVANSGQYGGSNAYWPRSDAHIRQGFHTHGQPQASIAFLEIDDIGAFLERHNDSGANAGDWKHPPAGLNPSLRGGSS